MSEPAVEIKNPALLIWPFDAGAYVVWRKCGCYWMRAGTGVLVAPCLAHGSDLVQSVRAEEARGGPRG